MTDRAAKTLFFSSLFFVLFSLQAVCAGESGLTFGEDSQGEYAIYKIKKGETLYVDIVPRFASRIDAADVKKACETIMARS